MLFLDLDEITLDSGAVFDPAPGGEARARLMYAKPAPGLADGEHTITFAPAYASKVADAISQLQDFAQKKFEKSELLED